MMDHMPMPPKVEQECRIDPSRYHYLRPFGNAVTYGEKKKEIPTTKTPIALGSTPAFGKSREGNGVLGLASPELPQRHPSVLPREMKKPVRE